MGIYKNACSECNIIPNDEHVETLKKAYEYVNKRFDEIEKGKGSAIPGQNFDR